MYSVYFVYYIVLVYTYTDPSTNRTISTNNPECSVIMNKGLLKFWFNYSLTQLKSVISSYKMYQTCTVNFNKLTHIIDVLFKVNLS